MKSLPPWRGVYQDHQPSHLLVNRGCSSDLRAIWSNSSGGENASRRGRPHSPVMLVLLISMVSAFILGHNLLWTLNHMVSSLIKKSSLLNKCSPSLLHKFLLSFKKKKKKAKPPEENPPCPEVLMQNPSLFFTGVKR